MIIGIILMATMTLPAGAFECHRIALAGPTNNHPDYDMWLTTDGDFIYVKEVVGGYINSVFELAELEGGVF